MSHVIVVGGGLAGLSAAHTVLERGGNVLLLDKNSFLGGMYTFHSCLSLSLSSPLLFSRVSWRGSFDLVCKDGEEDSTGVSLSYAGQLLDHHTQNRH
jgi:cation diffusion facilitator CzcD-associated flavoprotein CzcO